MLVLAKSIKGTYYMYNAKTAHKVSKNSAEKIRNVLNDKKYDLKDNEEWNIHDVDTYDMAYDYALIQKFTVYKNKIRDTYLW